MCVCVCVGMLIHSVLLLLLLVLFASRLGGFVIGAGCRLAPPGGAGSVIGIPRLIVNGPRRLGV